MFFQQPYPVKGTHRVVQPAFKHTIPVQMTISQPQSQQRRVDLPPANTQTKNIHIVNEIGKRESFKIVQSSHQKPKLEQQNQSRITQKPLHHVNELYNQSFSQTFPFKQKNFSPIKMFSTITQNKSSAVTKQAHPQIQIEKHFSSERPSNYNRKVNQQKDNSQKSMSSIQSYKKQQIELDLTLIEQQRKSKYLKEQKQTNDDKYQPKMIPSPRQNQQMFIITPADHNIIEENPYYEEKGEEMEQAQGQGSEQEFQNDTDIFDGNLEGKKRRKSITTFEMMYEQDESGNQCEQMTENDLLKLKGLLDKLSKYPAQTLEKSKMLKVLILGLYEERELYIDIGSIPQDWKLKSLAELLNRMYATQQGENHCMKNPGIAILHGRLQTKQLSNDMLILELIELAVQGKLGDEQLIVLQESQS